MFNPIQLENDVDSIVRTLEENCAEAQKVRAQIRELQQSSEVKEIEYQPTVPEKAPVFEDVLEESFENDEEMDAYIADYRQISGDDEESMMALLPDPDAYEFADVVYRLHAESLKEIKEMTEMAAEDPSMQEEAEAFIGNENKKIVLLMKLLQTEEEKEEQEETKNVIILLPLESGRIRVLDDIDTIPRDYYGKLNGLIQSIVDGSFKRFKRFFLTTNDTLADMAEVKKHGIRVVFKRLNKNTYAIITAFLKKTDRDLRYEENLKSIAAEYKKVENALYSNLENPEFMSLQEQYVQEMWNKLGVGETTKKYEKIGGQE